MNVGMLRPKKQPSKFKERVVFKFQFHLTRVPQGWDKLKVALFPLGSGKARNKTRRALVQYGSCRWPDPIVETTKLYLDVKVGRYDDKYYKLVIGSKTRVLGEVTINLAEYVNVPPSNSVVLSLKNCSSNTLLHAIICSLTSLRNSVATPGDQSSASEDNLDDSSDTVASSKSQCLSTNPPPQRDIMVPSRYIADTAVSPSGSISSSVVNPDRRKQRFQRSSSTDLQLRSMGTRLPNESNESLDISTHRYSRSKSSIGSERDFAFADKAVEELRMEAVTWQRRARTLGLEVRRLSDLLKQRAEMNVDIPEQGKLKEELQASRRSEETMRKEIEELRAELVSEKEANANASFELRRAQDSNAKFLLAIQDMEESLDEQRREIEDLSNLNADLESELHDAKLKLQGMGKICEREEARQGRGQDIDEMERELKDLTDENMELIFKVNKLARQLEAKDAESTHKDEITSLKITVAELEEKLLETEKFHQVQHSSNEKLMVRLQSMLHPSNSDKVFQLKTVTYAGELHGVGEESAVAGKFLARFQGDIKESEEQTVSKDRMPAPELNAVDKRLLDELQSKMAYIRDLQEKVLQLEMQKSGSDMKVQESLELDKLSKSQVLKLDMDLAASSAEIRHLRSDKQELENRISMLELEAAGASNQLQAFQIDVEEVISARRKLEQDMLNLRGLKQELEVQLRRLNEENLELREDSGKLEAENRLLIEKGKHATEVCAAQMDKERKAYGAARDEYEAKCTELLDKSLKLEDDYKMQLGVCRQIIAERDKFSHLAGKLEESNEHLRARLEEVEELVSVLQREHTVASTSMEKEIFILRDDKAELLERLSRVMGELEQRRLEQVAADALVVELGEGKSMLRANLRDNTTDDNSGNCAEQMQEVRNIYLQSEHSSNEETGEDTYDDSHFSKHDLGSHRCVKDIRKLELEFSSFMEAAERLSFEFEKEKAELQAAVEEWKARCMILERECQEHRRQTVVAASQVTDETVCKAALDDCMPSCEESQKNEHVEAAEVHIATDKQPGEQVPNWECEFALVTEELCRCERDKAAAESHVMDLKMEIVILEVALDEYKSKCAILADESEGYIQALVDLRAQVQTLKVLEGRVKELEDYVAGVEMSFRELQQENHRLKHLFKVEEEKVRRAEELARAAYKEKDGMQSCISSMEVKILKFQEKIEQAEMTTSQFGMESNKLMFKFEQIIQKYAEATSSIHLLGESWESKIAALEADAEHLKLESMECLHEIQEELNGLRQAYEELSEEKADLFARLEDRKCQASCLGADDLEAVKKVIPSLLLDSRARVEVLKEELEDLLLHEDNNAAAQEREAVTSIKDIELLEQSYLHQKTGSGLSEPFRLLAEYLAMEARLVRSIKQLCEDREASLQTRIEFLETTIDNFAASQSDALQQFQDELTRLQNQLCAVSQRERELMNKLSTHELLEKEVIRLQQMNEQVENKILKMKEASTWSDAYERVAMLEAELAEALEAGAVYRCQLERVVEATQQEDAGVVYKKRSVDLEIELQEMHKRYSGLTMKFAEVVAEKEELGRTLKSVQKSYDFQRKSLL